MWHGLGPKVALHHAPLLETREQLSTFVPTFRLRFVSDYGSLTHEVHQHNLISRPTNQDPSIGAFLESLSIRTV